MKKQILLLSLVTIFSCLLGSLIFDLIVMDEGFFILIVKYFISILLSMITIVLSVHEEKPRCYPIRYSRNPSDSCVFILQYYIDQNSLCYLLFAITEDGGEKLTTLYAKDTIFYKTLNENEDPYLEETAEKNLVYLPNTAKIELYQDFD